MRRDAGGDERTEDVRGDAVVQDAFAFDDFMLGAVARGGVVVVMDDDEIGVIGRVDGFGFAGIEQRAFFPWYTSVSEC